MTKNKKKMCLKSKDNNNHYYKLYNRAIIRAIPLLQNIVLYDVKDVTVKVSNYFNTLEWKNQISALHGG